MEFETDKDHISTLSDLSSLNVSNPIYAPINSKVDAIRESNLKEEQKRLAAEKEALEKATNIQEHMEGILIIDKINFKQPIIRGASAKNMLLSVTSFENTGNPGKLGKLCYHRSSKFNLWKKF